MPLAGKPATETFHNKISYSPSQPLLYLAAWLGRSFRRCQAHSGDAEYTPGLCCRCLGCPWRHGFVGAADVSGAACVSVVARRCRPARHVCCYFPGCRGVLWVRQVSGVWQVPRVLKMLLMKGVAAGSHETDGVGGGFVGLMIFESWVVSCI